MADVRVTFGARSRTPGTMIGMNVNTFGLDRLEGITGEDLAPIVLGGLDPAYQQAHNDWPVWTGASRDSMHTSVIEVGDKFARAALQVGGQELINDPRNKKRIDYAPYIEFNGTMHAPAGVISYAFSANRREMRDLIHAGVSALIASRLA